MLQRKRGCYLAVGEPGAQRRDPDVAGGDATASGEDATASGEDATASGEDATASGEGRDVYFLDRIGSMPRRISQSEICPPSSAVTAPAT